MIPGARSKNIIATVVVLGVSAAAVITFRADDDHTGGRAQEALPSASFVPDPVGARDGAGAATDRRYHYGQGFESRQGRASGSAGETHPSNKQKEKLP